MELREAELELFGVIQRFEIHHANLGDFALAVLLREYVRLKRASTLAEDAWWKPPLLLTGITDEDGRT